MPVHYVEQLLVWRVSGSAAFPRSVFTHGPGYRLYFLCDVDTVVLLSGATKTVSNVTSSAPGAWRRTGGRHT